VGNLSEDTMTEREQTLKALRTTIRAFPIVHSKAYLAFIRELPCIFCDATPVDAHHAALGYHNCKTSDLMAVPVCRPCHRDKAERIDLFDTVLVAMLRIWHDFLAKCVKCDEGNEQ